MIPILSTYIDKSAYKNIAQVFKTTYLSEGKLVKKFEDELAKHMGFVHPIAVNSGTSALHLALDLAGVKTGDEVITTPQTFVATSMAILYQRAKPVFADIIYSNGTIDPISVQKKITKKTKAILVVHWGGYPCDMDKITRIAKHHNITIIEDAAQALGANINDKPIGSISPFTCFSFQATKHVTTGDGGAVVCLDKTQTHEGFNKRWFGIDRLLSKPSLIGEREYNINTIGYKYHLNDFCAALGLANLKNLNNRLQKRRKIAEKYTYELSKINGIRLFEYNNNRKSAYWLYGFHVQERNNFIKAMKSRNIMTSVVHQRIDRNAIFGGLTKNLCEQEKFDSDQINIPIHDMLTEHDVKHIIHSIKQGW